MNIDDIFIKEYQTLPLKTLFEKGIFFSYQSFFVLNTPNLEIMEKLLEIFNFESKGEKDNYQYFIDSIINNLTEKLKNYKEENSTSVINIIKILVSKKIHAIDIHKIIYSLEQLLSTNKLIDLFSKILNENVIKDENINKMIIDYLKENYIKNNQLELIMSKISNIDYLTLLFEDIQLPKEEDFFISQEKK